MHLKLIWASSLKYYQAPSILGLDGAFF
jgi:hypothetical protein